MEIENAKSQLVADVGNCDSSAFIGRIFDVEKILSETRKEAPGQRNHLETIPPRPRDAPVCILTPGRRGVLGKLGGRSFRTGTQQRG